MAFLCYFLVALFPKIKNVFALLTTSSGAIFGLLFLPWFIHDVLEFIPLWMKVLIVVPSIVLWFAFLVMRNHATLIVIVYVYSFVVGWRVYKKCFGPLPAYNDHLFAKFLWFSNLVLYISPLIGTIQQRLGQFYNRYVAILLNIYLIKKRLPEKTNIMNDIGSTGTIPKTDILVRKNLEHQ